MKKSIADISPGECFIYAGKDYLMLDQTQHSYFYSEEITKEGRFCVRLADFALCKFGSVFQEEAEVYEVHT